MDATRLSDNSLVTLKHIDMKYHPHEVDIGRYFSSGPLVLDPKNHCVPIHESLDIPDSPNDVILVMPLLRPYDDPRLKTVGEAVEFFRQIFEVGPTCDPHSYHLSSHASRDCSSYINTTSPTGKWRGVRHDSTVLLTNSTAEAIA